MASVQVRFHLYKTSCSNQADNGPSSIDVVTQEIIGDPWFDHQSVTAQPLHFPTELNKPFSPAQSFRMKVSGLSARVETLLTPSFTKRTGESNC